MIRLFACFALLACASSGYAQSVTTAMSRDTLRVGDPVRVVIRIDDIPPGAEVVLPDSLASVDDVENAGRVRIQRDTVAAATRITAAYPIILWRPGEIALPNVPMVLRTGAGERTNVIALPPANVQSVLPPDTTNIEAKPAKDVWGADRVWWPYILLILLLIAIAALAWWWYRKRRRSRVEASVIEFIDPRERALQELQRIRAMQLIEQGHYKQHYILLSDVLRSFAASLESDWSTDLTTDELAHRLKRRSDSGPLLKLLRSADMVKFARREPTQLEARADLDASENWIRTFDRRADTAGAA